MKHVIFVLLFVIALSGMAWAETNPTEATQDVKVTVPGIFWLGWNNVPGDDLDPDILATIVLTEADIDEGWKEVVTGDDITYKSNYNSNDLEVKYSGFSGAGDGLFGLEVALDGATYQPLTGSYVDYYPDMGAGYEDFPVSYMVTDISLEDDPGDYTTVVSFQLSRP